MKTLGKMIFLFLLCTGYSSADLSDFVGHDMEGRYTYVDGWLKVPHKVLWEAIEEKAQAEGLDIPMLRMLPWKRNMMQLEDVELGTCDHYDDCVVLLLKTTFYSLSGLDHVPNKIVFAIKGRSVPFVRSASVFRAKGPVFTKKPKFFEGGLR